MPLNGPTAPSTPTCVPFLSLRFLAFCITYTSAPWLIVRIASNCLFTRSGESKRWQKNRPPPTGGKWQTPPHLFFISSNMYPIAFDCENWLHPPLIISVIPDYNSAWWAYRVQCSLKRHFFQFLAGMEKVWHWGHPQICLWSFMVIFGCECWGISWRLSTCPLLEGMTDVIMLVEMWVEGWVIKGEEMYRVRMGENIQSLMA